ncbi:LLM class flavin-dependent oxidoreductase [Microbacterium sp.]|uniref:LLM class flavin-dependent oxidoreductase n=1 Tax=Microbacterium sp. TaxID=51671 RepID=UPI003C73925F
MPGPGFFVALEIDGDGAHPSAWRFAEHQPDELLTPQRTVQTIRDAERHGFSAVTIQDSPQPPQAEPGITGRLDAVLRAGFAAPQTSGIGLIPVAHTTFAEPFHLSAQLSSLDHVSHGRAGWIATASGDAADGAAYGREAISDADAVQSESGDVIRAARLLWDSWEDEAVIRDATSSRYLDRDRIHPAGFDGRSFTVHAAAITPRPPQGQVPVFAALDALPAQLIDVALLTGTHIEELQASASLARAAGIPRVLGELEVVLPVQGRTAQERLAELDEAARRDALASSAAPPRPRHVGDVDSLVAVLAQLAEFVDGVRLHPAVLDVDGEELGRAVLPRLRQRGLLTSTAPGQTLRESLGLPRPDNVFAIGTAQQLQHVREESRA